MSEKCLWVGFWKHHCRGHTYVKKMGTDNNMPLRYSGQTVTFMEDEGIALVHIQVGGVGGNVGYVVDVIVAHTPVVVSNHEGVERVRLSL